VTSLPAFLVVGGDSLVGAGLVRSLNARHHRVYATTRRRDTLDDRRIRLDFEDPAEFVPPGDVGSVFVVAAASNYERCETDPLAYKINVEVIPKLVVSLFKRVVSVTFISTNALFGGERPWPQEDDAHAPVIAYAVQKHEAETILSAAARELDAGARFSIVRLTKVLGMQTPPLPSWLDSWRRGQVVEPFSDLIFAPMSDRFVGEALATIGEQRVSGAFHLSGAQNVSYLDFALVLAAQIGVDRSLVVPTTADRKGVRIAFKPRFSGLGMRRTTEITGIGLQPLVDVVSDLVAQMQSIDKGGRT
jgi:dTDP-4-dehydrorhamnose reductase